MSGQRLFKNTLPVLLALKKRNNLLPSSEELNKHKMKSIKPLKVKAIFKMFPMYCWVTKGDCRTVNIVHTAYIKLQASSIRGHWTETRKDIHENANNTYPCPVRFLAKVMLLLTFCYGFLFFFVYSKHVFIFCKLLPKKKKQLKKLGVSGEGLIQGGTDLSVWATV